MYVGVPVRVAGQNIGEIAAAEPTRDGRARLELRIDEGAWPLPSDSRFRLHFGGTVSSSNRYIEIDPGSGSTNLAEGAVIAARQVSIPLEVDELAGTFPAGVRRDLRSLLNRGGVAMTAAKPQLRRVLSRAPAAIDETRAVAEALGAEPGQLDALVRSGDRVTAAHRRRRSDARRPRGTFQRCAGRDRGRERSAARNAGERARAPGVGSHDAGASRSHANNGDRPVATPASGCQRGRSPRRAARAASTPRPIHGPGCDPRARHAATRDTRPGSAAHPRARAVAESSRPVAELGRQLACIRPYAPELAGFFGTWSSAAGQGDGKDKYGRVALGTYPFHPGMPLTVPQLKKIYPAALTEYAFPRPPGRNAGQPWFLPQCGVGPDSLDPSKDPEARPFDPLSKNLVSFPRSSGGSR